MDLAFPYISALACMRKISMRISAKSIYYSLPTYNIIMVSRFWLWKSSYSTTSRLVMRNWGRNAHILATLAFSKIDFCMGNWPIFSVHHRNTRIQNFHLKKISDLLDRYFWACAHFWNYSATTGVARVIQKSPKIAILYKKWVVVESEWSLSRDFG